MTRRHVAVALLPALLLMGALTACGSAAAVSDTPSDTDDASTNDGNATTTTTDDGSESFTGFTVSGTGSYTIPDQVPFGSYQLVGDPGSLPDGCTWSITDDDDEIVAESQGAYVFITDVDEASTFTTDGCPDWELFE